MPGPRADDIDGWESVRERLHARGLRWTPQRRALVTVLSQTRGHVTGAVLVERCREQDPSTIPSTVYRTLEVLEELGIVRRDAVFEATLASAARLAVSSSG